MLRRLMLSFSMLYCTTVVLCSTISVASLHGRAAPLDQTSAIAQFGNPLVVSMTLLHPIGARARWSPDGSRFVFDRRNFDGYYNLYLSDRAGNTLASLTKGKHINQRHNGNGMYRYRGDYIVFVSEEMEHFLDFLAPFGPVPIGEPGVGLFNNLWATDAQEFWRLTNIPIKKTPNDNIPVIATVNPRFSPDSTMLVWTERYAEGGHNNWGKWRLKAADFVVGPDGPSLSNERVIFTPSVGTYVTAMEFMTPRVLLVAGNLDGQHEYGMDLYLLHIATGTVRNLTNTPDVWEEGSCIAPSGKIVYMTNQDSRFPLDFNRDWVGQPVERDYWIMDPDGSNKERLTYFNDPAAPEYQGWRTVTIVCDISPDGKTMAATVGRDFGDETLARVQWQVWLIEFQEPL